jgi:D-sedoheptulose 7-phosphate isomerase
MWLNRDHALARQVEAFGQPGDLFLGICAEGNCAGMVSAFSTARRLGMRCLAILGGSGGEIRRLADLSILVPSDEPQRIHEVQSVIVNILGELVQEHFAVELQEPGRPNNVWKMPRRTEHRPAVLREAVS